VNPDEIEVNAGEVEEELARDPLSYALFRKAVMAVQLRKALARIEQLQQQDGGPRGD
jgi:hypothetical protein